MECISCRKNPNEIKRRERQTTKKGKSTIVIVNYACMLVCLPINCIIRVYFSAEACWCVCVSREGGVAKVFVIQSAVLKGNGPPPASVTMTP